MKIFKYESYEQYLDCQKDHEKTKHRTAGRPFDKYITKIKENFGDKVKKILCVGSRDVSEVLAFRKAGYEAIGIDLFSEDESIIKTLDMNNLGFTFQEDEFDLVYSCHSFEHTPYPDLLLQSFLKVSKYGTFIVLPFHFEPHHKDPLALNFMLYGQMEGEGINNHIVEFDFNDLLNNQLIIQPSNQPVLWKKDTRCKVIDMDIFPLKPKRADGYWISLEWVKNKKVN